MYSYIRFINNSSSTVTEEPKIRKAFKVRLFLESLADFCPIGNFLQSDGFEFWHLPMR